MKQRFTTTATLPEALRDLYEIAQPLPGGPRYAMPQYGQGTVDFSRLSLAQAEALIAAGFGGLKRKPDPVAHIAAAEQPPPRRIETPTAIPPASRKRKRAPK